MTKVLNFTSVAAAPVSERLACGLLDSHCENGLAISRTINKEIAQFRADQHVKIKVGSLLAITADHEFRAHQLSQAMNDYDNMNRAKQQADEALLERSEDLGVAAANLADWRVHTRHNLDRFFNTYPTADANDDNLRLIMTAAIEGAKREITRLQNENKMLKKMQADAAQQKLSAEGEAATLKTSNQILNENCDALHRQLEEATNFIREKKQVISSMQRIIDGLHEEVASLKKHNDEVVHLNRSQADEIALLNKANEGLRATIDGLNQEVEDLEKGNEHLDQTISQVVCQRDDLSNLMNSAKSEIANYQRLVEDLKAGTAVDRDTVKRQEETIQRLYGMLNDWHDWATDVIGSPSSMGVEAQRTAISEAMKKRQARIDGQDSAIRAISYQRDSWLQWAKQFTGTDKASCSELLELVKAEVSSREKAFYNNGYLAGKIAASKPKSHDTWSIKTDGPAVMNGTVKVGGVAARAGAMIENAVVMSGSVKASKVTFSDEMKAAIREVVQAVMDEALKQSIQNEIKKLLK